MRQERQLKKTRRIGWRAALAMLALACGGAVGCDLILPQTRMDKGQLYQSGEARYDQYFQAVHREQVSATGWPDNRRAARRPLVSALALVPNASDGTIIDATRAKRGDAQIVAAVEQTSQAERDRAARVRGKIGVYDDLARQGDSMSLHVREQFRAQGEPKAREVKDELAASVNAMKTLSSQAKHEAADADDFVEDLKSALAGNQRGAHGGGESKAQGSTRDESKPPPPAKSSDALPPPKPPKSDSKPKPPPQEDKPKPPAEEKKPPPPQGDEPFNP